MKALLIILFLQIGVNITTYEKFEVIIDKNTTRADIKEYRKNAKLKGIDMKMLYISYYDSDKVKAIQVKFECEIGSNTATANFADGSDACIYYFRDFDPEAEIAIGIGTCPKEREPEES